MKSCAHACATPKPLQRAAANVATWSGCLGTSCSRWCRFWRVRASCECAHSLLISASVPPLVLLACSVRACWRPTSSPAMWTAQRSASAGRSSRARLPACDCEQSVASRGCPHWEAASAQIFQFESTRQPYSNRTVHCSSHDAHCKIKRGTASSLCLLALTQSSTSLVGTALLPYLHPLSQIVCCSFACQPEPTFGCRSLRAAAAASMPLVSRCAKPRLPSLLLLPPLSFLVLLLWPFFCGYTWPRSVRTSLCIYSCMHAINLTHVTDVTLMPMHGSTR